MTDTTTARILDGKRIAEDLLCLLQGQVEARVAAGKARPGIVNSLNNAVKPDTVATVFAGGDIEATARLRELLSTYPPSSPSVAIFQGGKPVYYMPRFEIEGSDALTISQKLKNAYEQHCTPTAQ